jgi:hypothetical protein
MTALKKQRKPTDNVEVHFVFVEAPFEKVASEIMKWEEASWWPKDSGISVVRSPAGPVQMGTIFQYKLTKSILKGWTAEVTGYTPNRLLASTFKSGLLQGAEAITIEERANGTRVEYEIRYQVKGLLFKILWTLLGERPHVMAIKKILAAFRNYMIEKSKHDQDKKFEGST